MHIISPAAGFVGPLGALVLGIVAGVVCFFAIHWIKRRLAIDDALDVFPVHGVGGMLGSLLTAPLASEALAQSRATAATAARAARIARVARCRRACRARCRSPRW